MQLFDKILSLNKNHRFSKHQQIVEGVLMSIDERILNIGDKLPSVVQMGKELTFANRTIAMAYDELKKRGVIESRKTKGYYVISKKTEIKRKLALILYAFHAFQENFYNTFRNELGDKYQIDIYFHHNNISLFETILDNTKNRYSYFVIAALQEKKAKELILNFSPEKTLLIDRYLKLPKKYSYIFQEFEDTIYQKLVELTADIKKYNKFVLFYKSDADYPKGILKAFKKYTKDYTINSEILSVYKDGSVEKGVLYFFIGDAYYWELLRDVQKSNLTLGKDLGILAQNDSIEKEVSFGGITTLSTDFHQMGIQSAKHIKNNKESHEFIPTTLNVRNSI